ncbi:MAG: acetolactate synthase large subunit [Myxococcota bacterium]
MVQYNGAESLVSTAVSRGVRICFANPGTTELPLVEALDAVSGMRAVLCLFEGVCSAAADGYARMSGEPAMTLLHLGPGFANGIANFHNARRARSPVFNVIGDHATWHRASDPPLASDLLSLASPVSGWLRAATDSQQLAGDAGEAIAAARTGLVATLIAPHDVQLGAAGQRREPFEAPKPSDPSPPDPAIVSKAAQQLHAGGACALFLGGAGLSERGLVASARIASATGCRLICDTFPARLERGGRLPPVERLPYFPEQALECLAGLRSIVLAGTLPPVSFFGYPGVPAQMTDAQTLSIGLAGLADDVCTALEQLADALGTGESVSTSGAARPPTPAGGSELTPENVAAVIASLQSEGAIVMDEGLTAGLPYFDAAQAAPRHTYLALTGGAIGQGLPCATGAALACPQRPVIALQADGSGLYTLQSLWTQARESLNVTNVILANGGYKILEAEIARSGETPGPQASALTTFDPVPNWAKLAQGFGVPGARVDDIESLAREFARATHAPGPHLIEVRM